MASSLPLVHLLDISSAVCPHGKTATVCCSFNAELQISFPKSAYLFLKNEDIPLCPSNISSTATEVYMKWRGQYSCPHEKLTIHQFVFRPTIFLHNSPASPFHRHLPILSGTTVHTSPHHHLPGGAACKVS